MARETRRGKLPVDTSAEEARLELDLRYVTHGIACYAVLERICPPRYGLTVLEPGCGSGKFGIWYTLRGAAVTLLDINPKVIRYTRRLWQVAREAVPVTCSYSTPSFHVGSVCNLPFPDNTFDLVLNEGVPQHWGYNPHDWRRQRSINEMVRVTKPSGYICVIANNADCPEIMEMAARVDHDYMGMPKREKPFTKAELLERLHKAGILEPYVIGVPDHPEFDAPRLIAGWGVKEGLR